MSVEATATSPNPHEQEIELEQHTCTWLATGRASLDAALAAIEAARDSVRLEMYIFARSPIGDLFRDALIAAARRGAEVKLLIDAVGSFELPDGYFGELSAEPTAAVRWFNKPSLATWSFRDHRKLLVTDDSLAFVTGCNIATEYYGDGVTEGWRDGGVSIAGPVLACLITEFENQWRTAEQRQWRHRAARRRRLRRVPAGAEVDAIFGFPGFGRSPLREAIRNDLAHARNIAITCSYFLPGTSLRLQIAAPVRRGARVRLITAGKTDVPLMQLATRSLYNFFLRRNVEVYEYEPQILHAKVLILDDIVYVGSSNLDPRSLRINFEIMLRMHDRDLAAVAWKQFEDDIAHSRRWTFADVRGHRTWWRRVKQRVAYFILARLDPRVAEGNLRRWLRGQRHHARTKAP
jgi:cardiolipin synthase